MLGVEVAWCYFGGGEEGWGLLGGLNVVISIVFISLF